MDFAEERCHWEDETDNKCDATEMPWPDMVNHPPHYEREGAMECIDEMIMIFGKEAVKHFCLCNAWKYRYRAQSKHGYEDIKKSDWYINKYKELNNTSTTSSTTITSPGYNIYTTNYCGSK